jgi:hypothetical protein
MPTRRVAVKWLPWPGRRSALEDVYRTLSERLALVAYGARHVCCGGRSMGHGLDTAGSRADWGYRRTNARSSLGRAQNVRPHLR